MDAFPHLLNAILVIALIYALAVLLRARNVLSEAHSLTLALIVTDLCLPAMIFVSLAGHPVHLDQIGPALVMLGVELLCIAVAWGIADLLGFERAQRGAIVFCSAFGSSTFLGYSLILQMFPQSTAALSEGVLISEIGVGYPIFILGPILATHFGSDVPGRRFHWRASLDFFKSPVFFALFAGMLWGALRLPGEEQPMLAPFFQLGHVLAQALTPLAILSIGLLFRFPHPSRIILPLAIVVLLKLVLQPALAGLFADQLGFPGLWKQVLTLLAAMPPAVLGAVFLKRYGGDAALASSLLLVASLTSCVTLLGVFWFIG